MPGGFYGTVTFSVASVQPEAGEDAKVVTRLGSLLFVRVPGAVAAAGELESVAVSGKKNQRQLLLGFNNSGSIYLNPYGLAAIKSVGIGEDRELVIDPWYVLPQSSRVREVTLPTDLVPGIYRATVSLNRGYGDIVDQSSTVFVAWPSPKIMIILGAGLLLILFLLILKRLLFALIFIIIVGALVFASNAFGEVASSTNYQIQTDSLNFAGGFSTSTNYEIGDTLGELGTSTSTSATYNLRAGYRPMLESYLAVSAPGNVSMSPAVDGSGDSSLGSAAWTVTTDNPAGYTLAIKASTNPALTAGANNFTDYSPAGAVPDYTWTIATSSALFGFSPEGTHITTRYKDNGAVCGTGALDTSSSCWDGLSTTNRTIASSTSSNQPTGTATTVKLQAATGASKTQTAGSYTATLTVTALVQ